MGKLYMPTIINTELINFERVLVLWRWVYTKGKTLWQIQMNFPKSFRYLMPLITRRMKGQASGQGMGRHSQEEVIEMGMKDLTAISAYLGAVR